MAKDKTSKNKNTDHFLKFLQLATALALTNATQLRLNLLEHEKLTCTINYIYIYIDQNKKTITFRKKN